MTISHTQSNDMRDFEILNILTLPERMRVKVISEHHPDLVSELAQYEPVDTLRRIGFLLTIPALHANTIRIEALSHLVAANSRGGELADRKRIGKWINDDLGRGYMVHLEDPPEDVFVGNVVTAFGNARVFEGVWENNSDNLQHVLDVIATVPASEGNSAQLRASADALLKISDAVAERRCLERYIGSPNSAKQRIRVPPENELSTGAASLSFSEMELAEAGIRLADLAPFTLDIGEYARVQEEAVGHSTLERKPLLPDSKGISLAVPTAVSSAIRRFVLEWMEERHLTHLMAHNLAGHQATEVKACLDTRYQARLRSTPRALNPATQEPFQVWYQFGDGLLAHVVIDHDKLEGVVNGGLQSLHTASPAMQEPLRSLVKREAENASRKVNYRGGMSVVLTGGLGRPHILGLPGMPHKWHLVSMGVHDFILLSREPEISLKRLWKLQEQVRLMEARGVSIGATNGFLNLYSAWKSNGFSLIPHEYPLHEESGVIAFGTDFVTSLRLELRQGADLHNSPTASGSWAKVERERLTSYFREDEREPKFVSFEEGMKGNPLAVIEVDSVFWWVGICSHSPQQHRDIAFRIWQALSNWMIKAGPILSRQFPSLRTSVIDVMLDFSPLRDLPQLNRELPEWARNSPGVRLAVAGRRLTLYVLPGFLGLLATPENDAEVVLIGTVGRGAVQLAKGKDFDEDGFAKDVTGSKDARFVHLFQGDVIDAVEQLSDGKTSRFIPEEDVRQAEVGLAWEVVKSGRRRRIGGDEDCSQFLHAATDVIWLRIKRRLNDVDRRELILQLLANLDRIRTDSVRWRNTARALLSLHKDKQDVHRAFREQVNQFDMTSLCSRVLIEMAVCNAKCIGGYAPTQVDTDYLLANVSQLITLGYISDGVHYGCIAPSVGIWPNGEIDPDDVIIRTVMAPRMAEHLAERFDDAAQRYDDLYRAGAAGSTKVGLVDKNYENFAEAFLLEYGLTPERVLKFIVALSRIAINKSTPSLFVKQEHLVGLKLPDGDLSAEELSLIITHFVLPVRRDWEKDVPEGFTPRDWYPWKFRRRLSLVLRPIIPLADGRDPSYIIPVPILNAGMRHLMGFIMDAALPSDYFATHAMRAWVAERTEAKGREFEKAVYEVCRGLGFDARLNQDVQALLGVNVPADLGEVDVIAWHRKDKRVFIIECKRLYFAKTVGEIGEQLWRFRGGKDKAGKPDELARHLRRTKFIGQNKERLAAQLGIGSDISVIPVLVFSSKVPMRYAKDLPLANQRILTIEDLRRKLRVLR